MTDLSLAEVQAIADRMNSRHGRGPSTGMITLQTIQDAMQGKTLAHHPVTSEILGEVTYQVGLRPPNKAPRTKLKTKTKKQPRKK